MITYRKKLNSRKIKKAVKKGLAPFKRAEPLTLSQWADKNYYLSSESSYVEGPWETLPFQKAMMNSIGHADIEVINIIKSARVGYTQMIKASIAYFIEHKPRNQIVYQPVDNDAEKFMKSHVETMIRDVKKVKQFAPWYGKKARESTIDTKIFTNKKTLWVLGGKAARNYREKSPDNVYYDELSAFDDDIEKEGSPTGLGDKRIEGSAFPKSVRGSTPKTEGACQITKAADEAECYMEFHLPCPDCTGEQVLRWGGKDTNYGIKWHDDDPKTACYLCEHCGVEIQNQYLESMQEKGVWRCRDTKTYTVDGIDFYNDDGTARDAPVSITYWVWTAYSLFTTWEKIVTDFYKAKGDRSKMKTFTNTTLGETWVEEEGEQLDNDILYARREHYPAECPHDVGVVTCAVDVQDDRFEVEHVLWLHGEESYRISYRRIYGDLSRSEVWKVLKTEITRQFTGPNGMLFEARICFIDSGGHYTDEVYNFSRKNGVRKFVPVKGHSLMGKPIASFPRKMNSKRIYLTMIGTDTAKELIASRLKQTDFGGGYMHYPHKDEFDEEFFKQLTNEKRVLRIKNGKKCYSWEAGGRRNEPFDLAVYNLAAIRTLQQNFGVKLPAAPDQQTEEVDNTPPKMQNVDNKPTSVRINNSNDFLGNIGEDWV